MSFEGIIEWFSAAANTLAFAQLVAAFVTAIATFALWRVTRVLADETKTLAAMTSRPFVVCGIESSIVAATAFNLVLRNTGNAAAFDIKTKITPPLPQADGTIAEGKTETSADVSYLPPGQVLARSVVMARDIHDVEYSVEISWASSPTGKEREKLSYTFEGRDGFYGGVKAKGMHEIANELTEIKKHLAKA